MKVNPEVAARIAALPTLEELQARGAPVLSRRLTPEEKAAVVKRPSPRRFGTKGEQWFKSRLTKCGASLHKNIDALCTAQDKRTGETYHFRQRSKFVDFSGTIPLLTGNNPQIVTVQMEVKAFQKSFSLKDLKQHQHDILAAAKSRGELSLVGLVLHEQGKILKGWLFVYRSPNHPKSKRTQGIPDWADLLAAVADNALTDKRFKGKSVRQVDLKGFDECVIVKTKGRWQVCPWLNKLLPKESPELW